MAFEMTDKMNTLAIRQFFTRQNFPNPDLSIFIPVKILRHMVATQMLCVFYCIYDTQGELIE